MREGKNGLVQASRECPGDRSVLKGATAALIDFWRPSTNSYAGLVLRLSKLNTDGHKTMHHLFDGRWAGAGISPSHMPRLRLGTAAVFTTIE